MSEKQIKQRYLTTIPKDIRLKAKMNVRDGLIWDYDEIRDEIIVIKKPQRFSDALWGLGKKIWERVCRKRERSMEVRDYYFD